MGVCVDRTIIQKESFLGIDVYNFFWTQSMEKNVKMQIEATRCQHLGSNT
jgi:hypothetical protein